MMDSQLALNLLFGGFCTLAVWVLKVIWDGQAKIQESHADMREKLHDFQTQMHSDFVRREDFKDFAQEMKDMLSKIYDKLDNKADK
jgi:hypothetical protein